MTLNTDRAIAGWLVFLFVLANLASCSGNTRSSLGEPIDIENAVTLKELFSEKSMTGEMNVVVSGTVGQVCRSAGCWFVLEDTSGGDHFELLVDLKPAASFTLDQRAGGRRAIVQGRLKGNVPDIEMWADGLVLE